MLLHSKLMKQKDMSFRNFPLTSVSMMQRLYSNLPEALAPSKDLLKGLKTLNQFLMDTLNE
jgi:hypothetical protein